MIMRCISTEWEPISSDGMKYGASESVQTAMKMFPNQANTASRNAVQTWEQVSQ